MKIPEPGRERNFFYCRGRDQAGIGIFLLPGPGLGREQNFLNDRGRAGTVKIENVGAGPGSNFYYCRAGPGFIFFVAGAGIVFIAGAGPRSEFFFIAGAGAGLGSKILK